LVVAGSAEEHVIAGDPTQIVGRGIADERVGSCCSVQHLLLDRGSSPRSAVIETDLLDLIVGPILPEPVVGGELIGGAVDGEDQMIAIASEGDVARLDSRAQLNGIDHSRRRIGILYGVLGTASTQRICSGSSSAVAASRMTQALSTRRASDLPTSST